MKSLATSQTVRGNLVLIDLSALRIRTAFSASRLRAIRDCLLYAGFGFAILGGIGAVTAQKPELIAPVLAIEPPHAGADPRHTQGLAEQEATQLASALIVYQQNLSKYATLQHSEDSQPVDRWGWQNWEPIAVSELDWNSPAEAARREVELLAKEIEIEAGDTLMALLTGNGVSAEQAHEAIDAVKEVYSPRDLKIGQKITLNLKSGETPELLGISLNPSATTDITVSRGKDGAFVAKAESIALTTRLTRSSAEIRSSLFVATREAGVPMPIAQDIIRAFSFDVDFQRDIQPGDSFDVVFERMEDKTGAIAKTGKLLYAALTLSGKTHALYYFDRDGAGQYYSAAGASARKSLLKTPVDGAKLTSGFGMRNHPILGYTKMHKGADFGAPKGTPVYAAGDGTVVEAGVKGAYGNYVRIKHNGQYQTAYAHLSRFSKGLRKGSKVNQGDVIAYVGSTGRSTGPHLHYEILVNGTQVNPKSIKTVSGGALAGKDLQNFRNQVAKINQQRDQLKVPSLIAERP